MKAIKFHENHSTRTAADECAASAGFAYPSSWDLRHAKDIRGL